MTTYNENFNDLSIATTEKKSIAQILEESKSVDTDGVAMEVLTWINNNVEQFIDNQVRLFKLDLIIDAEDGAVETMPLTKKLQDLYRAIPENGLEEQVGKCRERLDSIAEEIYLKMKSNTDMLSSIFKHMGFYYEMKGINQGNLLVDELSGEVSINKFEYEAFTVGVQISAPNVHFEDNDAKKEIVKEYMIPEGFTVWIEIAFKPKKQTMGSLF
jgi:hypothetical protein